MHCFAHFLASMHACVAVTFIEMARLTSIAIVIFPPSNIIIIIIIIMISQYRHMCIDYRIKHRIFIIYKSLHALRADGKLCRQLIAYLYITILFIINNYLLICTAWYLAPCSKGVGHCVCVFLHKYVMAKHDIIIRGVQWPFKSKKAPSFYS